MKRGIIGLGAAVLATAGVLVDFQPSHVPAARAGEIGFTEEFALAPDRNVPLKQLIPGTEEHFFYTCLMAQNQGDFAKADQVLEAWAKTHTTTALWQQMDRRQTLLKYDKNPRESLAALTRQMGLTFPYEREVAQKAAALPTELDPKLISRETLTTRAFNNHGDTLYGFEASSLEWLVSTKLSEAQVHQLLSRLSRPDYPDLSKLVVADLKSKYNRGFGSLNVHNMLLLSQMDELITLYPDILNDTRFVYAYLGKLRPSNDADIKHDVKEHMAYLDRQWAFVSRLGPVHNTLKANVLYHRLVLDRSQGVYDKDRFLAYLQLPRRVFYINPRLLDDVRQRNEHFADLAADVSSATLMPPIGTDEPLVRSYLLKFLVDAEKFDEYKPLVDTPYLQAAFAEAKITNGIGDQEKWYALLSPEQYRALKDRIDIDFAFTNKTLFAPDQPVKLDLAVKNVSTLIVKVYEINAANFYRANEREIDTDINLDGLVANEETVVKYDEPALRRAPRSFEFPKLKGRGVWVVEFIGNGRSSRALVRKGKLNFLERVGAAGQVITVLDEAGKLVPTATLSLGDREFTPDKESGDITVPFSTAPGPTSIILRDGDFACLSTLNHQGEAYRFQAAFHVDRATLIRDAASAVVIRPNLCIGYTPVSAKRLENVVLTITSVDRDGVATSKQVPDFKLYDDKESTYEFQTPDRLAVVTFMLTAKVQNYSQNKKDDVVAYHSFTVNQIDATPATEDLFVSHIDGEYVVDLLGKTGEARADRPVSFVFKTRDFTNTVDVTLKTDAKGRIRLGKLDGIDAVVARSPEGSERRFVPARGFYTRHAIVDGRTGRPIRIAYLGNKAAPDASELSLLEVRGSTFVADRFKNLSIKDGYVVLSDLPAGDYNLLLKNEDFTVQVRIADGPDAPNNAGWVLGANRYLQTPDPEPMAISSIATDKDTIKIQLVNAPTSARVHVIATRFMPDQNVFVNLGAIRFPEPSGLVLGKPDTSYITGRDIGDEYRYVIDRKYAPHLPGNMLNRPQLLLNPWSIRKTETGVQQAAEGESFGAAGGQSTTSNIKETVQRQPLAPPPYSGQTSNLDFLSGPSIVLANLRPDDKGIITIQRKDLAGHQQVHVIAIDPVVTAYREVSLPETAPKYRDLRLLNGLDVAKHFTEQRQITVLKKGDSLIIADPASAEMEVYDSLPKLYKLYATLSADPTLAEFSFITTWPTLKPEEKRAKYSQYACHELSYFLYRRDPEFFKTVIVPYLKNKKDKTFMDHWLLGDDLSEYLKPWAYERLNTVEQVLLAQRIDGEGPRTARHVKDRYDLLPPDIEAFNRLFRTAIKGGALDTTAGYFGDYSKPGAANWNGMPPAASPAGGRADDAALASEDGGGRAGLEMQKRALRDRADKEKNLPGSPAQPKEELKRLKSQIDELVVMQNKDMKQLGKYREFYRRLDKTEEWVENNYYKLPIERQVASLITVDALWRDYATSIAADAKASFLSTNLAEGYRSFTEIMFALSNLDLPFDPAKHAVEKKDGKLTLTAAGPVVVYHKQVLETPAAVDKSPILVTQNYYRLTDRYTYVDNERTDKFVTGEFLTGVVYGCQVVVTNPTSGKQKLELLLQIPRGAMPVVNTHYTYGTTVDLNSYQTQSVEYYFYFPAVGEFPHYPLHVSRNGKLIAFCPAATLKVVAQPSKVDTTSWDYISQNGTEEEVLKFLRDNNIDRLNLERIAWRMKNKEFFVTVTDLLNQRHVYNQILFSYAAMHDHLPTLREFLRHSEGYLDSCGPYIDCKLITIDPVARLRYQHMEYSPLVNARAHRLGKTRQIVNDRFFQQYSQLTTILCYRPALDDDDRMAVTYYLLLQDRVDEARTIFALVNPAKLATRLQYDYFVAYLDFFKDKPEKARAIVDRYKDHPVDRWRNLFAAVGAELDELQGKAPAVVNKEDRSQRQTNLAATEPEFDFKIDTGKITLNHQNLDSVRVNYYLMDVELLFSQNPFIQQVSGQFAFIRPNETAIVKLDPKAAATTIELPAKFHNSNVMIEIVAGGQTKAQACYANSLAVQVVENYGQLKLTSQKSGQPLAKAYIKVYARMTDGSVRFYKDGYTDLRGRFDYTSLSTDEQDRVERYSILVLSDTDGAIVKETAPPKR